MAGKKFKFRVDGNNKVGIKEVINRVMSARGERISYSVGLTKDFVVAPKFIVKDNLFVPILETKSLKRGRGGKAVYYSLNDISYIATLTLQYNKKGKVVERTLILYTPYTLCSMDEIYCNRRIGSVSVEEKDEIMNTITESILV